MKKIEKVILETDNFLTGQRACKNAMMNKDMIAVVGPSGSGKTTCFSSFQGQYPDNVYIVIARKSMNARLFYSSITNSIADESYNPLLPLYFCIKKAANVFLEDSSNKLLIIDDAGKLSPSMLEYLHEFREMTRETTGIILGGVEYFQTNLMMWNSKNKPGMPEIYSRISALQILNKPQYNEVVALIQAYGIKDTSFERSNKGVENFRILKNRINLYRAILEKSDE